LFLKKLTKIDQQINTQECFDLARFVEEDKIAEEYPFCIELELKTIRTGKKRESNFYGLVLKSEITNCYFKKVADDII